MQWTEQYVGYYSQILDFLPT